MTRMRAPFSSFSLWLSDLSSVKIWDSRGKEIILQLYCFRWYNDKFTRTIYCIVKLSPQTTSGLKVVFQLPLRPSNEDMLYSTWSCKWGVTLTTCSSCEKWERIKSNREKLREGQFPKSRSCISWGAMTKNIHPRCQSISPLLETNNNPLL